MYKKMKKHYFKPMINNNYERDSVMDSIIIDDSLPPEEYSKLSRFIYNEGPKPDPLDEIIEDMKKEMTKYSVPNKSVLHRTKSTSNLQTVKRKSVMPAINDYLEYMLIKYYDNILKDHNLGKDIIKLMLSTETLNIIKYLQKLIKEALAPDNPSLILREDCGNSRALTYFMEISIGPIKIKDDIFKEDPAKLSNNDINNKMIILENTILNKITRAPSLFKMILNDMFMRARYKFGTIGSHIAIYAVIIMRYYGNQVFAGKDMNKFRYLGKYWGMFMRRINPDESDEFMIKFMKEMNSVDKFIDMPKIKVSSDDKKIIINELIKYDTSKYHIYCNLTK